MVIKKAKLKTMGADTYTYSDGGCNWKERKNKHCIQDIPGGSKRKTHTKSKAILKTTLRTSWNRQWWQAYDGRAYSSVREVKSHFITYLYLYGRVEYNKKSTHKYIISFEAKQSVYILKGALWG